MKDLASPAQLSGAMRGMVPGRRDRDGFRTDQHVRSL